MVFIPRWERHKQRLSRDYTVNWGHQLTEHIHSILLPHSDLRLYNREREVNRSSFSGVSVFDESIYLNNSILAYDGLTIPSTNNLALLAVIDTKDLSGGGQIAARDNFALSRRNYQFRIGSFNGDSVSISTIHWPGVVSNLLGSCGRESGVVAISNKIGAVSEGAVNGVLNYGVAPSSFSNNNPQLCIGVRRESSNWVERPLGLILNMFVEFSSALTTDEVLALSEAPYQILKPRVIYFDMGATAAFKSAPIKYHNSANLITPVAKVWDGAASSWKNSTIKVKG